MFYTNAQRTLSCYSAVCADEEDKSMQGEKNKSIRHMSELLKVDGGLFRASFSNVEIAVRIHLTIGAYL